MSYTKKISFDKVHSKRYKWINVRDWVKKKQIKLSAKLHWNKTTSTKLYLYFCHIKFVDSISFLYILNALCTLEDETLWYTLANSWQISCIQFGTKCSHKYFIRCEMWKTKIYMINEDKNEFSTLTSDEWTRRERKVER